MLRYSTYKFHFIKLANIIFLFFIGIQNLKLNIIFNIIFIIDEVIYFNDEQYSSREN